MIDQKLSELAADDPGFTILLSHRPELFDSYVDHDMDLALSGHAHGGQFRRVFDRILEVCVPVMYGGDSFRKSTAADNLKNGGSAARLMNPRKELLRGELHRHQQDRQHAPRPQLPLRFVRRDEKAGQAPGV